MQYIPQLSYCPRLNGPCIYIYCTPCFHALCYHIPYLRRPLNLEPIWTSRHLNDLKDLCASGDAADLRGFATTLSFCRPLRPCAFGVSPQKAQIYTLGTSPLLMFVHLPWSHCSQDSLKRKLDHGKVLKDTEFISPLYHEAITVTWAFGPSANTSD